MQGLSWKELWRRRDAGDPRAAAALREANGKLAATRARGEAQQRALLDNLNAEAKQIAREAGERNRRQERRERVMLVVTGVSCFAAVVAAAAAVVSVLT
jgi:ABC-type uncharacterized transport system fused permease/ATPase subunit